MRVATVQAGPNVVHGIIDQAEIVDLRGPYVDSTALLVALGEPESRAAVETAMRSAPRISLEKVQYLPPIPEPRRILCVGTNYADHIAESDRVTERPDHPMIFTRYPSSLVGHGAPLVRPPESTAFDYEGELAIVIGQTTRRATRANAREAIGGYSCFMDGTIRDWQRHTSQFTPGKTFENTGSWGPWIVSADEVPDHYALRLHTVLDGVEVQGASTKQLIFDIEEIIVYCSTFTTLEPGDVIATGTPGGVGYARDPQEWLRPGREIAVEVPGVGRISNTIIDEELT